MNPQSIWQKISEKPLQYPPLAGEIEVDVAIIGGGITGVTAALELLRAGKKVALVEAATMGGITTSLSTGNLYVPVQSLYHTLVKKFGENIAKKVADSRASTIDYIEKNVNELQIDCSFTRRPWYAYSSKKEEGRVQAEYDSLKKLAFPVETVHELPFDLPCKTAFMLPHQARFNPLQYVIGLVHALDKQGCFIYEQTPVLKIKDANPCLLFTKKGKITAGAIFMATHTPIGINSSQLFTAPYRSYVIGATVGDYHYPEANLWSYNGAHFALSTHATKGKRPDIVTIAGSHHKTGQTTPMEAHFEEIIHFLQRNFQGAEIKYRWSAQHYHTADGLPYIGLAGRRAKNCYMATGYFADGLVYGSLAGKMVANLILHRSHPSQILYSSHRFKLSTSFGFIAKENLNVLNQYAHDLPKKEQSNFSEIKKGEGKVVEVNREKIAVFRDDTNKLHKVSAVCTHMKCIVNWNDAEQTWDCPCHGSRFKITGEVIEGPALCGLRKLN